MRFDEPTNRVQVIEKNQSQFVRVEVLNAKIEEMKKGQSIYQTIKHQEKFTSELNEVPLSKLKFERSKEKYGVTLPGTESEHADSINELLKNDDIDNLRGMRIIHDLAKCNNLIPGSIDLLQFCLSPKKDGTQLAVANIKCDTYDTFKSILDKKIVLVNMKKCNVFEHFNFQHCNNFLKKGHCASGCSFQPACKLCARPHPTKDSKSSDASCVRCIRHNEYQEANFASQPVLFSSGHKFIYPHCPPSPMI